MKKLLTAGAAVFLAGGAVLNAAPSFPYEIPFELGASGFAAGDKITITSVRGERRHIESGWSYQVEGTYTLNSADSAELALFCTTRGPSGSTPVQKEEEVKVLKGSGKFVLFETNVPDGWLHVSFYPKGSSSGGVYFGEKGREETIMRNASWFRQTDNQKSSGANRALMDYLGNPVPRPADMDARYDKDNLMKAFTALCGKADLVITKLDVDDSEFPFLLYGTLSGSHKLPEKADFETQKGYTYGGSVRGSSGEAGTYFAVNMVPREQYPEEQETACSRRLMVRLQMLADRAKQTIQE